MAQKLNIIYTMHAKEKNKLKKLFSIDSTVKSTHHFFFFFQYKQPLQDGSYTFSTVNIYLERNIFLEINLSSFLLSLVLLSVFPRQLIEQKVIFLFTDYCHQPCLFYCFSISLFQYQCNIAASSTVTGSVCLTGFVFSLSALSVLLAVYTSHHTLPLSQMHLCDLIFSALPLFCVASLI